LAAIPPKLVVNYHIINAAIIGKNLAHLSSEPDAITFTLADNGNIKSSTRVGTGAQWVYQGHRVTQAGNNTYGYDSNGNMTSRNGATLVYDFENRLTSIEKNGVTNTYLYDYTGARIKKTAGASGSSTTYIGNLYECTDGACTKYIFAGGKRIAAKKDSGISYFHLDHLGGLSLATDYTGETVQSASYYPYGETRESSGPENFQYKFTGQEEDPESGLYYYGARFYDPVIGRFISADSVVQAPGDPQTLNRYAYCRNNPLLYTDPTGHIFGIDDAIIIAVLSKAAIGAVLGAALNTTIAALTGGDLGTAAMTGAIAGGIFGGVGALNLTGVVAAGAHAAAGVASGAINAGITGGNVLQSAAISGISAGFAKYAMAGILPSTSLYQQAGDWGQLGLEGATAIATGTVMGGVSSAMMGGSFGAGAAQGAWTSAYGFMFNQVLTVWRRTPDGRVVPQQIDAETGESYYPGSGKDPLTDFTQRYVVPSMAKAYSFIAGACVTVATGSPALGGFAYDATSLVVDLSTGTTGDLPIPGTPLSIPDAIHPGEVW